MLKLITLANKSNSSATLLVATLVLVATGAANAGATAVGQSGAAIDRNALLVDSVVCTVVLKASIEASQGLGAGNPIDALVTVPATCVGNTMPQTQVGGGVRQMLISGFRQIGVSHQVTTLAVTPSGKAELLISAIFALERSNGIVLGGTR
jgi:hypothetical protein